MAKCDLLIELDHPDDMQQGGGTVTGVVRVIVDADVKCSGLEVQSVWRTHGRGNVATGTSGSVTLFSGQWRAGETHEYRFELPVADWPPTYHGHYLNVDHYVDARARIPWAFDPKASVPFRMQPSVVGAGAAVQRPATNAKGVVGCILGGIMFAFLAAFLIGFAVAGPFALFFLAVPLIGFVIWFVRKFLPRWALGAIVVDLPVEMISPGESAQGELTIEPKKGVSINGITLKFQAREECVSGSGSNRTTHKHVFYEQTEVLQDATTLAAGITHRFPVSVALPSDASYSLDLSDNDLIWSATLRVDIPRWPDWVREIPIRVVPAQKSVAESAEPAGQTAALASAPEPFGGREAVGSSPPPPTSQGGEEGFTFAETASHIWASRDLPDQIDLLVEAVTGLTFDLEAIVERRLLYAGDEDPHVYDDGYAIWAHFPTPPLPMVMYVPHELADEFEQVGRDLWRGRGTIVGWDHQHRRLQVKLER